MTYRVKEEGNLRCKADEVLVPEVILIVAEELDKGDQSTPWVRTVDEEAL